MILGEHPVQLVTCGTDAIPVIRIHYKYHTVGVIVVVPPQRSNFILSSNIPYGEANISVLYGLNIEP